MYRYYGVIDVVKCEGGRRGLRTKRRRNDCESKQSGELSTVTKHTFYYTVTPKVNVRGLMIALTRR